MKIAICIALSFLLVSCQSALVESRIEPGEFRSAITASELPVRDVVEFTAETDPNDQIGRPNGYIAKFSWTDEREPNFQCTVEFFSSVEDLDLRKRHLEQVHAAMPLTRQYVFIHKNAILRVPLKLTPDQASRYEAILKAL